MAMKLRTVSTLCLTGAMLFTTGCDKYKMLGISPREDDSRQTEIMTEESAAEATTAEGIPTVELSGDYPQLTDTAENEVIAVMKTSKGDITLRLFPDKAPKAVENFVTHAENGYYDGLTFHRVIKDFMIQGGDPNGDGTGGESIYGESFDDEITDKMRSFRGSLCMANSGPNTNGSQFYIVQNNGIDENYKALFEIFLDNQDKYMKDLDENTKSLILSVLTKHDAYLSDDSEAKVSDIYPKEVVYEYMRNGGCPFLDFGYTIFGQVKSGMEVVDAIAAVKTNSSDDKPLEDIVIDSIEIQ